MPKIIIIAHQKGGVGKSTLALNLAYAFAQQTSTAIIDLDVQGTISRVSHLIGEGGPVVLASNTNIAGVDGFNVLFIDTPPYNNDRLPGLLEIADVVIIPTKAGFPDAMAIESTVGFVKAGQAKNKRLRAGIVINMIKPRSGMTEAVKDQLEGYGIPLIAEIGDRVSYAKSIVTGGVIAGTDALAKNEINGLVNEILKML